MWPSTGPPQATSNGQLLNSTAVTSSGSDAADVSMAVPDLPDLSAVKKTPVRGETAAPRIYKTPLSGNSRSILLRKATSCVAAVSSSSSAVSATSLGGAPKTPNSGSRVNPFDSQISHDTLHLPTFSPSVFSTVLSPSQESQHSSGRFWSVDQQAMLFPAQISEDSPWKQETATSRLDPETENKTQEAIDLYFSQHHEVTSPENDTTAGISQIVAINERSVAAMDESVLGGSPDLSRPKLSRSCNAGGTTATTTSTSPMKQPSAVECHAQPASGDVSNNVTFASVQ